MRIKKYKDMISLIKDNLVEEHGPTEVLINQLKGVCEKGYLDKNEFLKICMWKSPRPKNGMNRIAKTR